MTIAASATQRGARYFFDASENEMTIATSAIERGGRYFLHHRPQVLVLHKMK
ncbi:MULTISPECIES: hypothetical protein [Okeania]|uniref:hypothetical protein n=1 Tax=Okeania TaxID=1458928 RepID=UPI00137527C3|nr:MULTISPECIES: hypothetical protein [Okeania]NET13185.1 hypothetical protein [Okeania sp. SIO1H6]NET19185.1 hypothetical protein [Okeania sp. SIO1H5]NES89557.1 hypothetical protein [Okeania sp. SIO2B9]NET74955.1 hypothetical protein [Okeania sp. SIO1F9]NET93543.1 hypothetical protein [Okeania sp. SIO1H2]